mmetsp:Transcript_9144/g.12447  ORF Transcript_9144/g.12447 Transcript_9144/m.12447 type:complete len:209 (-) Transcript_9144:352-978(-)|eukprot:CAMPEP_0185577802 /NCGR_PEP_ID=MMETSP0434-20130131/11052_1 /TAXON_ID=626734 ORGANISM="Favella taraikaensis, Strain Fe Narragansett Bay" /NCGR_SAMPLE_ID=MMETSP0434 /ASSEMBLY_ACC=CAM_ASM_000379 /LENGTH=208 /DNA_ID=CAMNT_0028195461 /DNA_START=344 /DNA_END=970 /DNA_ORIENTATION=+
MRQGMIGGLLLSPGLHFFLTRVMSRAVFPSLSARANIGLRVAIHQACMMPLIQFTLLFLSAAMQPAGSIEDRVAAGKQRFHDKWRTGFSASLMFWPAVNTVMYSMVQPRFMNLYADMASLIFASIMSYITYKDCAATCETEEVRPTLAVPSLPTIDTQQLPAIDMLTEAVQTIPLVWQSHLLSLFLDGKRVEAQSAHDDTPWLLSTTT